MARFPVTVAQRREYVHRNGRLEGDERSLRGRDNDPVLHVSWHDAQRFCDFLRDAWRGLLPPGFVVTLPSEVEWEKAARGGERVPAPGSLSVTHQRLVEALEEMPSVKLTANPSPGLAYPWDESFDADRANVEFAIGETSATGCYPAGSSPYGCEEMSGNVWEWTRSLWGTDIMKPNFGYPYDPNDPKREQPDAGDEVYRVVRGGSWDGDRFDARCACRGRFPPGLRFSGLGFRVVLRSAPVS